MVLESVRFHYPKSSAFYEIGQRISYEPTGKESDRQSLMIQSISLEPTGQIALGLSGGKIVLVGNVPYDVYARPYNDQEIEAIEKKKKELAQQLPPAAPQQAVNLGEGE